MQSMIILFTASGSVLPVSTLFCSDVVVVLVRRSGTFCVRCRFLLERTLLWCLLVTASAN